MFKWTMIHPFFVHFTIALYIVSVVFDVIGLLKKKEQFHKVAWINLLCAGIATVLTAVTGLLTKDNLQFPQNVFSVMDIHQTMAFLITACILGLIFWRIGLKGKFPYNNTLLYLMISIAGLIVLIIGTYYGHKLVYHHGIGVQKHSSLLQLNSKYEKRVLLKHNYQKMIFRRQ